MNSLTLSQQQAVVARGNVLVTAGAGTGKTSTLVQRCMALLAEGCSLENILLVTFTEAAAVEMRGRIREALQDKVGAPENSEAEAAGAREHFEKQLALLDTALISTLHGFCRQLVREHFYELGIDPDVLVLDEQQTQPLIQQTLDALFERHYAGDSASARAVQTLVRVQGHGSDERIRALILKLHRYAQTLAAPENWLESQRAIFTRSEPVQWRAWLTGSLPEWRDLWLPILTRFAGTPAVDLALAALRGISAQPDFERLAQTWQAIRSADDKANWPKGSIGKVRAELEDFFDEAEFLASLAPANGIDPLAEDWELVRHDMLALLDLARDFTAEFSRAKRDLGGVDFADLEQFALRVLRDPASGALTPAARQWQRQLHYIFVDEYQDINAAQDAILAALSREGKEANRFLVGDVKQSIYRFRLANPGIFRRYQKQWSHAPDSADSFSSPKGGEGRGLSRQSAAAADEEANVSGEQNPSPRPSPRLGGEREEKNAARTCGSPAKLLRYAVKVCGPKPSARRRASVRGSSSGSASRPSNLPSGCRRASISCAWPP
jgi:ATP-dependent helicase/nuclease subunit A